MHGGRPRRRDAMLRDAMLAAVFAAAAAAEVKNGITVLTDDSFDGFAAKHAAFGLVVYAPWCGHRSLPSWRWRASWAQAARQGGRHRGRGARDAARRQGVPHRLLRRDGGRTRTARREAAPIKQWLQQRIPAGEGAGHGGRARRVREEGGRERREARGDARQRRHAGARGLPRRRRRRGLPCALADPALAASEGQTGLAAPALVLYTSFDGGRAVLSGAGELTAEGMARSSRPSRSRSSCRTQRRWRRPSSAATCGHACSCHTARRRPRPRSSRRRKGCAHRRLLPDRRRKHADVADARHGAGGWAACGRGRRRRSPSG